MYYEKVVQVLCPEPILLGAMYAFFYRIYSELDSNMYKCMQIYNFFRVLLLDWLLN